MCRVEICRSTGNLLRKFEFTECEGGASQEFRGVRRSELLKALHSVVEPGTVQVGP